MSPFVRLATLNFQPNFEQGKPYIAVRVSLHEVRPLSTKNELRSSNRSILAKQLAFCIGQNFLFTVRLPNVAWS